MKSCYKELWMQLPAGMGFMHITRNVEQEKARRSEPFLVQHTKEWFNAETAFPNRSEAASDCGQQPAQDCQQQRALCS